MFAFAGARPLILGGSIGGSGRTPVPVTEPAQAAAVPVAEAASAPAAVTGSVTGAEPAVWPLTAADLGDELLPDRKGARVGRRSGQ